MSRHLPITTPLDHVRPRLNVYDVVTDRMVDLLNAGTVPWRRSWGMRDSDGVVMPANLLTRRSYRGVNVFLLAAQGYERPYWLTFNQARKEGMRVKKGSHGTPVIFWNWTRKKDAESGEVKEIPFLRYYTVFNVDQVDGAHTLLPPEVDVPEPEPFAVLEAAERMLDSYVDRPTVVYGGGNACYRPSTDVVTLPERHRFTNPEEFYSTLFHELGHSTGHRSRLNRLAEGASFGSHAYSKEELVAEMTAAFLCAVTGITTPALEENTAAYLDGWIRTLRGDSKLVVLAAANAQRAADMIRGISHATADVAKEEQAA